MARTLALVLLCIAPSAGAEPFEYFANPWSVVGLKDYPTATRISPRHSLVIPDGTELQVLVGPSLRPPGADAVVTLDRGYRPIVETRGAAGGIEYRIEAFAAPIPNGPGTLDERWEYSGAMDGYVTYVRVVACNSRREAAKASFGLQWLSGRQPTEAMARANALVLADASGHAAYLWPPEVAEWDGEARRAAWHAELPPGGRIEARIAIPLGPATDADGIDPSGLPGWRQAVARWWDGLLRESAWFSLPEAKVDETFKASLVYQLIGNDDGVVKAGEGFYDGFFLRDGAFQILSYEMTNRLADARRAVEHARVYQRDSGQLVSQEHEFDGNGQGLWTFWSYYAFTRDREFLADVYPQMRKAVEWIADTRVVDAPGQLPGILPKSAADGENLWGGQHQIVGYDAWNLRGLQCALWAAETLGEEDHARWMRELLQDYRAAVLKAVRDTGLGYFPAAYQVGGTSWGNLTLLHPTLLFEPDDKYVARTLDHVRFGPNGFAEGTIRWSPWQGPLIHPYMSTYVTNNALVRAEQRQVVEDFYWYLLHTTSTNGFCEGLNYVSKIGWGDVLPHLWAAAQYIVLTRNMLIREQGDDLHLLSAVPPGWVAPGKTIQVSRAPTHFGEMSMSVAGTPTGLRIDLDPPRRNPPERLLLHLPPQFAARSVVADGATIAREGDAYRLPVDGRTVIVRGRLSGPLPSFDRTVSEYLATQRSPIIDLKLVPLPLDRHPAESDWSFLDLRSVATTDPQRAPFMVPQTPAPGAYLFTGLAPGRIEVEGVPFEIIDASENDGRGLVVLQGDSACAELPRRAAIDVGERASTVFFLGGVGGWGGGDGGSDGLGTVARYIIEYADGGKQEVPLVTGITIDDWASPPMATQVSGILLGPERWHLNLHAVDTADRLIKRILLIDEGTRTSPVLAAVTLLGP